MNVHIVTKDRIILSQNLQITIFFISQKPFA
jgi:hypothetical protein